MSTHDLSARLRRLEVQHGGQYLPVVLVLPDANGAARDEMLSQVQRLRQQGRHVITLSESDKHLALDELAEVFAP